MKLSCGLHATWTCWKPSPMGVRMMEPLLRRSYVPWAQTRVPVMQSGCEPEAGYQRREGGHEEDRRGRAGAIRRSRTGAGYSCSGCYAQSKQRRALLWTTKATSAFYATDLPRPSHPPDIPANKHPNSKHAPLVTYLNLASS